MKIKNDVANVYHPINKSPYGGFKKEKGIPAIAKPNKYPYPQYRFFKAMITVGIIVVKIIVKYDQISIEPNMISIFTQDTTKPKIIHIIVKISILNSGSGLPTVCSFFLLDMVDLCTYNNLFFL